MEQQVNQRSSVNLEIIKGQRSYLFLIPIGAEWDEIVSTLEEMKSAVAELKRMQDEAYAKQQEEVVIEPEIVEEAHG